MITLDATHLEISCLFLVALKISEGFIDMLDSRKEHNRDICGGQSMKDHLRRHRLNWKSSHKTLKCSSRMGKD